MSDKIDFTNLKIDWKKYCPEVKLPKDISMMQLYSEFGEDVNVFVDVFHKVSMQLAKKMAAIGGPLGLYLNNTNTDGYIRHARIAYDHASMILPFTLYVDSQSRYSYRSLRYVKYIQGHAMHFYISPLFISRQECYENTQIKSVTGIGRFPVLDSSTILKREYYEI